MKQFIELSPTSNGRGRYVVTDPKTGRKVQVISNKSYDKLIIREEFSNELLQRIGFNEKRILSFIAKYVRRRKYKSFFNLKKIQRENEDLRERLMLRGQYNNIRHVDLMLFD